MYSRPQRQDPRVPYNYGGSIFGSRAEPSTPVEDLTRRRPTHEQKHKPAPEAIYEEPADGYPEPFLQNVEASNEEDEAPQQKEAAASTPTSSIFSPIGALGTEELLLIALALIVFQGGKEPELALILLALLFIN